jgi:hypothetical protein
MTRTIAPRPTQPIVEHNGALALAICEVSRSDQRHPLFAPGLVEMPQEVRRPADNANRWALARFEQTVAARHAQALMGVGRWGFIGGQGQAGS